MIKPLISVLMSIYNEEIDDISKAMNSILTQTYKNIELIIIIDDSKRYMEKDIIDIIVDERVRVYVNETNLGLALSMNKAAELAQGEYLARMDADDISLPERLEKQYEYIKKNAFDYVCTWFDFIDEKGSRIERNIIRYDDSNVNRLLPYMNTIHHPTVMIKRDVFKKVGGYRNFPCAQDYDLWLRLYEQSYRVGCIKEVLFLYRIRANSITSNKAVQQYYTQAYARKLLKERKAKGMDSYSIENYNSFLEKKRVFDNGYTKSISEEMKRSYQRNILYKGLLLIKKPFFRHYFMSGIRGRFVKRFYFGE